MVAECKQKMTEGLMTFVHNLTLTCYGKQSAILIFDNMADTRAMFKPKFLF
jgi:hypothetical protein